MSIKYIEKFKKYLHIMHKEALNIYENILGKSKDIINFFKTRYGVEERYWSIKKLYGFAMFLPVFLQIGLKYRNLKYFSDVVYIDTHAGPGLAKIGAEENEIVLGSPLIALRWPTIIASNPHLKKFHPIKEGFDQYIFIDKDKNIASILRKVLNTIASEWNIDLSRISIVNADSNKLLRNGRKFLDKYLSGKNPLLLVFIDPFGDLDTQLRFNALSSLLESYRKIDIVLNIMSGPLVRALSGCLKTNYSLYKLYVQVLFGDSCEEIDEARKISICRYYVNASSWKEKINIPRDDIVSLYGLMLKKKFEYKYVEVLPVEYRGKNILYHILFGSRSHGAHKWLGNYMKYIKEQLLNLDYETLKSIWLSVSGKGKIDKWFPQN